MRLEVISTVAALVLARLHAAAFAAQPPADIWDEAYFIKLLHLPTTRGLLADEDGKPRGFVLWQQTADFGEIITIGVQPESQGQGVGRALLMAMEDILRASKVPAAVLDVAADNMTALSLYLKSGYQKIHIRPAYYRRYVEGRDHRVDAMVLQKNL